VWPTTHPQLARAVRWITITPAAPARVFFFFNDTATTEIYTLSLHDALPIFDPPHAAVLDPGGGGHLDPHRGRDRKSTRLNSSHMSISYAVFCLKKKDQCLDLHCPVHREHRLGHLVLLGLRD